MAVRILPHRPALRRRRLGSIPHRPPRHQEAVDREQQVTEQPYCYRRRVAQNLEMARAAVLAELIRWDSLGSIQRKLKKDAVNTLTSRYAFTWKRQEDVDRNNLSSYSDTASSWGQRAVVATAIQSDWPIASLENIEEVQKIRGGPRREVSMVLPRGRPGVEPSGSAILRFITGY